MGKKFEEFAKKLKEELAVKGICSAKTFAELLPGKSYQACYTWYVGDVLPKPAVFNTIMEKFHLSPELQEKYQASKPQKLKGNISKAVSEPVDDKVRFGDALAEARDKLCLEQKAVENMIGAGAGSCSRWESGRSIPNWSMFRKIDEIYHLSQEVKDLYSKLSVRWTKNGDRKDIPEESVRARETRKKHGWSQIELSEKAGVCTNCIVKFESGRPVEASSKRKILEALGIPYLAQSKPVSHSEVQKIKQIIQQNKIEDIAAQASNIAASLRVDTEQEVLDDLTAVIQACKHLRDSLSVLFSQRSSSIQPAESVSIQRDTKPSRPLSPSDILIGLARKDTSDLYPLRIGTTTRSFGEIMRDLQRKNGLTDDELAEYLGVSVENIRDIENMAVWPLQTKIPSILDLFSVDISQLCPLPGIFDSFASFINYLIEETGLTLSVIAGAFDVPVSRLENWQAGSTIPTPNEVRDIAATLGLNKKALGNLVIWPDQAVWESRRK